MDHQPRADHEGFQIPSRCWLHHTKRCIITEYFHLYLNFKLIIRGTISTIIFEGSNVRLISRPYVPICPANIRSVWKAPPRLSFALSLWGTSYTNSPANFSRELTLIFLRMTSLSVPSSFLLLLSPDSSQQPPASGRLVLVVTFRVTLVWKSCQHTDSDLGHMFLGAPGVSSPPWTTVGPDQVGRHRLHIPVVDCTR